MNEYSDQSKKIIREFFDEEIPKFHFTVTAEPDSMLNMRHVKSIMHVCKQLKKTADYDELETFIYNIAENSEDKNFNEFEIEILASAGYKTLLYINDMSYDIFELNIQAHTCEYLRQKGYITAKNVKEFGEVVFVAFNNNEQYQGFSLLYGSRNQEMLPYIELIYDSQWHKVVVTKRTGKNLIFTLEEILSYDYKDFDIHQSIENDLANQKVKLPDDPDTIRAVVELIGLKRVILPAYVFESTTKC